MPPFSGLNLGNLSAALSMTGGDPSLVDKLRLAQDAMPQPSQATPERSVVPPSANQALELTGSKYRVPDAPATAQAAPAQPAQAAPAAPSPAPLTSAQPFDPNVGTKALKSELTGGKNDVLDTITQAGDVRSQGAKRSAGAIGDLEAKGIERLAKTESRVDDERLSRQRQERLALDRLDKANALIDHPPDASKGMVLRAIGAMLSLGGSDGGGIGAGLQMIGEGMRGDIAGWKAQIGAQQGAMQSHLALAGNARDNADFELRTDKALNDMAFSHTDLALKRFAEETKSDEERIAATKLRAETRNKYVESQLEINAHEAKLAADAKKAAALNNLWKQSPEQLAAQMAQGKLGKEGQSILTEKLKREQSARKGEADIGKTEADAAAAMAKANAKANGEENGIVHVGGTPYVASSPVEKGALTKFTEQSVALGGVQSDLAKLYQIRQRNEGKPLNNANDVRDAKLLINGLTDKLSNFYGGGAAGEAAAERTLSSIADPTDVALRGDPKAVYASISKNLQDSMVSGLSGAGFKPRVAPKAAEQPAPTAAPPQSPTSAAAPSSAAPVRLYRSDGSQTGPLDPSKARVLLDSGKFFPSPPPAPSPDAMANASDADYEEQVRRSQGYQ